MNKYELETILSNFPKKRATLPSAYKDVYANEYIENRNAGGFGNKMARKLESWMHKQIANEPTILDIELLELGAGSLNHLAWESNYSKYDVVEPFRELLKTSPDLDLINDHYDYLSLVPKSNRYDRVLSVAVLEHVLDLPYTIALSALLLKSSGSFCAGIPSEGGLAWKLAWQYGTGPGFKRRTGLDYSVLINYEHVNSAHEIEALIHYFYATVKVTRFPLSIFNASLYSYIVATDPKLDLCEKFCDEWVRNVAS